MYRLRIAEVVKNSGLTAQEVARRCGITKGAFHRYMTTEDTTISKLQMIADAIGCRIRDLYEEDNEIVEEAEKAINEFIWDNGRERQLRLLIRSFDSVAKDITDMSEKAKELLDDSVL